MSNHSLHPFAHYSPGILDVRASLPLVPYPPAIASRHLPEAHGVLPPLSFLLLAARLAELYEMAFPDQPHWLDEEIAWPDEEAVAVAVGRFLGRVSALFPVNEEMWDVDLEVIEWQLYEIPLIPMGFDEWYEGWDEWPEPVPYLLHLRHSRAQGEGTPSGDDFAKLYPAHSMPGSLEVQRLVESLRQICTERSASGNLPEPLTALPDLILMLEHNTGNDWLDVGEIALAESGGYPSWHPETITWLTEEWRLAQPVWEGVHRLLDWQSESPADITDKLTAVQDLLLAAWQRSQEPEANISEERP